MITKETIEELYTTRAAELERIRDFLDAEFAAAILKKLKKERHQLLQIAESEELLLAARRKYSLVLDPAYFQQKFYSNRS